MESPPIASSRPPQSIPSPLQLHMRGGEPRYWSGRDGITRRIHPADGTRVRARDHA